MKNPNRFYVYEHWRPDRNECFYVGKGARRRAQKMIDRNRFHMAIQGKLSRLGMCVEVRMIAYGLTESQAFLLEIERIAMWRADGADIANITIGGEGRAGIEAANRSPVTCLTDGKIFPSQMHACDHYQISPACLAQTLKGVRAKVKGLQFIHGIVNFSQENRDDLINEINFQRVKNRKRVSEIKQSYIGVIQGKDSLGRSAAGPMKNSRPVICTSDGMEFPSINEAGRFYGVCSSAIMQLCAGKRGRKTVGGLVFKYKEPI